MNLSGLGPGIAEGYQEFQTQDIQNQLRQQALQDARMNQAADAALYGGLRGGGLGAGPYGPPPMGAGPLPPSPPEGPAPQIPASPTGMPPGGAPGMGPPMPGMPQNAMTPQMQAPPGGQQPQMAGLGRSPLPQSPAQQPPPGQAPLPQIPGPQGGPQQPPGSPPWQMPGQPAAQQASMGGDSPQATMQFAVQQAQQYGHDPATFVKMIQSEGGFGWDVGDRGTSFGPTQLHTPGGLGDEYQKDTGRNPRDPRNKLDMIAWSARNLGRTGYAPYHGARRVGISDWQGVNRGSTGGPPAGAGGPSGGPPLGEGGYGMTLESLIDRIERANPNLPPEIKMRAIARGMQLLQPESRQQFQMMMQMYKGMQAQGLQGLKGEQKQEEIAARGAETQALQDKKGAQQQDAIAARGNVQSTLQDKKGAQADELEDRRQKGRVELEKLRQEGRKELATKRAADRVELQKLSNDARIAAAKERGGAAGAKEYMTPEQQQKVAEYVAKTGDYTMLQGLGRAGADRAKIEGKLMDLGISPEDLQANRMESLANTESFKGMGRIQGRMSTAIEGTKLLEPPLREAMKGLWRSGIPALDRIVRIANREIAASPEEIKFSIAIQSYLNKYADAMSKAYTTTDNARRHAYDLLKEHWSMEQLGAGIDQLDTELRSESRAVKNAMDEIRTQMGAKPRHGPGQMDRGGGGSPGGTPSTDGWRIVQ